MGTDTLLFEKFGMDVPAGKVLFTEGDAGEKMYIIKEGKVKITKRIKGKEHLLAILGKGEFFGEMAIVNRIKRTATAVAMTEARLLEFDRTGFVQMIEKNAEIALSVIDRLCRRLGSAVEKLKHFMTKGEDGLVALNLYYAFKESSRGRTIDDYESLLDETALHLDMPRDQIESIVDNLLAAGIMSRKGNSLSLVDEDKLFELTEKL
jgi:CRP/FNR family cyclic AMP-dependent transcriptional regulator